ncbi:unnamed protein product [Meloidogyne enterolobii]|uniref:Uncharacterized protein n=1 Tax=Meloidogyne enterolobii TaxID=390850 RepID=A0ACB0YKQ5_MELEN
MILEEKIIFGGENFLAFSICAHSPPQPLIIPFFPSPHCERELRAAASRKSPCHYKNTPKSLLSFI